MTHVSARQALLPLALAGLAWLQGCATTDNSLYQWEGYQYQVYEHFSGEGSTEQQIAELEKGLQKIRARGKTPPPGYHAHLGMLYAQLGKDDQVVQQFNTEQALFPEAKAYMDFLLKKQD
ncbi:DUF4810 domain-containing protein [Phytopseudomonas dryadis]|uniref:DUF4810 domain-containing protein n=1 Tax=Phytopseudomonas dryadis TaxID=2487520 RepID=A0A4Q9R413_9GAMM|nr:MULTISPECIES: DUF4810 domain-containing protein [Pseudomonas]TBU94724.1 DUF4810 domain-containing protein [Pseudomonas dryadis]TBV06794.1 DUF4810 domain-containing protein [Pseudomonas dryadis]TBV18629.1 DUF4810 domain-containing protein [Pseudomonas sp. FRB 230]